jgi:pseudaminic acid synthase
MAVKAFEIEGRLVGDGSEPYFIAEMSANHCGSLRTALEIVESAAAAGADAVKLQHYRPETMTVKSELPEFRISGGTLWDGETLFDLYGRAMTPWEWTDELLHCAARLGLSMFSTPFDASAVEFLATRNPVAFKIASFELTDLTLIRRASLEMKPMILSTGMATVAEIDLAIQTVRDAGNEQIAILRCNSSYPAPASEMDLKTISEMRAVWSLPVGLSDHTLGSVSAVVATAFGASIFEKHITLDRENGSPDAKFSSQPDEFAAYVKDVKTAFASVGRVRFGPSQSEEPSRAFRRSLRAVKPISQGERLTEENTQPRRPGGGLSPSDLELVLGRVTKTAIEVGDLIRVEDLS